ncbi:hypothetical protein jhhlp_001893 [Lomentospora prolificans]|uniref:Uncharacterized protein n=1 Tax=Lomentospora prolificans TaxID=41688 RepID=A0A2N3NCK2_9PEZI|nr:hypothetical protein jhhlp_001893 [Lomentospora prolificans]
MVTTRSGTKRKSMDKSDLAEPTELPATSPKRQRLPVREKDGESPAPKKASANNKTPSKKKKSAEDAEEEPSVDNEDITMDLDAALQRQLAAAHPSPAVTKKAETTAAAPAPAPEEEEDSDDEAPEAVSNVQAAEQARQSAQAAQKAVQEQAAREKKKRQERDARLKAQAESRKAKAPEEPAPGAAVAEPTEDAPAEEEDDEKALARPGKVKLPDFLPEEFLQDSDDEDAYQGDLSSVGEPRPKRRKGEQKKVVRDKKVGGAIYRVMNEVDQRLAPKNQRRSKDVKARLMQRNRSAVPQSKGFIVGRPTPKPDWGSSRR